MSTNSHPSSSSVPRFLLAISIAGSMGRAVHAEPESPNPHVVALKTERVVVFKDGHALILKSAAGRTDAQGALFTEDVPDSAILGSFWAVAEQGEIRSIRAEWVEDTELRRRTTPCLTVLELLRANVGRSLELTMKDAPSITSTIVELLELPGPAGPAAAAAGASGAPGAAGAPALTHAAWQSGTAGHHHLASGATAHPVVGETVRQLQPSGATLVVVETDDGKRRVLPVAAIKAVAGAELVTTVERQESVTSRGKRLRFDLGPERADEDITVDLMYFTPGVRWIPTYRVSGAMESTAELALQGEILNELEDIEGALLDLVVGVPNFRFKSVVSPLSLETALVNALATAAPNLMGQMSNMLFTQRSGEHRGTYTPADASATTPQLAPELAATGEQSLFVYNVGELSLRKGDRASVALWKNTVPLAHVYTMDVHVVRNAQAGHASRGQGTRALGGGGANGSPLQLIENTVWHQLELTNDSTVPWTTGAAMMIKGTLPLGQDLLTYTSPGGCALVPVTVAVNVRGTYREEEIGREANAIKWSGSHYARVSKKGTVTVTNSRSERIELRITASCGGRATAASDEGVITINDHEARDWEGGRHAINNHSEVSWKLTLEAGATKTLTLESEFYVR